MEEIKKALENLEEGNEITVYAIDGEPDSAIPDLAFGVIRQRFFDSDMTTFICGIYGSDTHFASFFEGDFEDYDMCRDKVIEWIDKTADAFCEDYRGLSLTTEK